MAYHLLRDRVLKVRLGTEVARLHVTASSDEAASPAEALDLVRATIIRGCGLEGTVASELVCRYEDEEGDLCLLSMHTMGDFLTQFPTGPLRLTAETQHGHGSMVATAQLAASAPSTATAMPRPAGLQRGTLVVGVQSGIPIASAQSAPRTTASTSSVDDQRVNRCLRLARSADEHVRRSAADALCDSAGARCAASLAALQVLTSSEDEYIRRTAADCLCAAVAAGASPPESVKALLEHADEHIRRAASAVSAHTSGEGQALQQPEAPAKRRRKSEQDEASRRAAADELIAAAAACEETGALVLEQLAMHEDEYIRRQAAAAVVETL